MRRRYQGASLVEILLVLVVGAGILYMSLQQYISYRKDADVMQVQANVDTLFQAMTGYYRQNCYGTSPSGTGDLTPGTLNPNPLNSAYKNPFPINIQTMLINNGLLKASIPLNPMVDSTSASWGGYIAQFNMGTPTQRQVCMSGTGAILGPSDPRCTAVMSTPSTANVGTIAIWMAQVAVQINNPTDNPELAQAYLKLLGGDCLSSASGSIVAPCTGSADSTGDYVVWSRLPYTANTESISNYWVTTPTVSQFKQMYTTSPILNLTNGTETPNQYYLCGN